MGLLWDLIQKHIDDAPYPPSERAIARKIGVSPFTMSNWKDDLKRLPSRENLQAVADLVGVRYSVVLDAALKDTGYHESATVTPLRRRPTTTIQAELRAAEETLAEWDALNVANEGEESKRPELQARVEALKAELAASRRVTSGTDSVAEL